MLAVDESLPGNAARAGQINEFHSIVTAVIDAHYDFDIWKYGAQPTHLWGPGELSSDDETDAIPGRDLKPVESGQKRVARPDLLLDQIANDSNFTHMSRGRIVFLTDGALTAPNGEALLAQAAQAFKTRQGWRVEVLGITPQNIPQWRNALASVFQNRYTLSSMDSSMSVLKHIHDD